MEPLVVLPEVRVCPNSVWQNGANQTTKTATAEKIDLATALLEGLINLPLRISWLHEFTI
jgi:phage terminase large subunit-like protein